MILTIDRVNDLLDDMADSFPAALFDAHRRSLAAGQENFSHLTA